MLLAVMVLCAVGFLISSYFTAVSWRWMKPDAQWIPSFCRMGERTCSTIVFTPRARVFGVPNSLLGQIYYPALLAGVWSGLLFESPFLYAYLAAALVTVAVGAFLSYSLLFLTRVPCPLCFASHFINLLLFLWLLTLL